MRYDECRRWLPGLFLAAAFLLPAGLTAQEPTPRPGGQRDTTQPQAQRPQREHCQQARERLRQAKQQINEERERYRLVVEQYGKDSPQAREAREQLQRHMRRMREARTKYSERCGQGHRGRDLEGGGTQRRRNPGGESQNPSGRP